MSEFYLEKKNLYDEMKIFMNKKYNSGFNTKTLVKNIIYSESTMEDEKTYLKNQDFTYREQIKYISSLKDIEMSIKNKIDSSKRLVSLQLKNTFSTSKHNENEIEQCFESSYLQIIKLEKLIKSQVSISLNDRERNLFKNVNNHYHDILNKYVKVLKTEEQSYFKIINTGPSNSAFDFINDDFMDSNTKKIYSESGEEMVMNQIKMEDQSSELKKIFEQINGLTNILGKVGELILEQGTVVDRIDVNITKTLVNTKKGNKELIRAKENLENGLASKIMKFLLIANLILFFIIILKYT